VKESGRVVKQSTIQGSATTRSPGVIDRGPSAVGAGPPLRSPTRSSRPPFAFAHPIEAEFARLLDYYGLAWDYEPRTFPLEWGPDGQATLCFTPDFYLRDQELFVELTTLSPRLMHRKNRKLRKLRELYPEIRVKLFSLRDVRALLLKYGNSLPNEEVDSAA
jgi:hypothetical protein